ncbi:hypothetical protein ACSPAH_14445 [Buttiauxella agrestis]
MIARLPGIGEFPFTGTFELMGDGDFPFTCGFFVPKEISERRSLTGAVPDGATLTYGEHWGNLYREQGQNQFGF